MSATAHKPLADLAIARPSLAAFLVAWALFWVLLVTVELQDFLRQGHTALWQPFLWEGSSCLVASAIVWLQWRHLPRLDGLLAQPWRWFMASLCWLPLAAPAFVCVVYALRHAVYALVGDSYRHEAWGAVFRYEMLKFSLFYLLFVAILFGMRAHAAMGAERVRSERLRTLTQQAQLLQLTQQIEPHFLFNALNTIASTIHTDPELADTLLLRLSALLRAATDLARRPEVALSEELQLLRAYTDIMVQRFASRVVVRFEIDPASLACQVPALALQPLVENAFRHGVEQQTRPGTVVIRGRRDGTQLRVEVEDDLGTLAQPTVLGTGLSNLQQRLLLRYGDQAHLSLNQRAGGGVVARIELPCVY